ncbi:kinase-like domain-containing protein, partial [Podospora aff. communis PSN243]
ISLPKGANLEAINLARELEALATFSCGEYEECFVTTYGWWTSNQTLYIAMEYLELGNLEGHLKTPMPEHHTAEIAFQLTEGLCYMHKNEFAHRDLKPDISDFGLSKHAVDGLTALNTRCGTILYTAPEVGDLFSLEELRSLSAEARSTYTTAVDIWSLGVIIFRMITGTLPFGYNMAGLPDYVTLGRPFPTAPLVRAGATRNCIKLVKATMAASSAARPTAQALLSAPWFE